MFKFQECRLLQIVSIRYYNKMLKSSLIVISVYLVVKLEKNENG